MLGWIATALLLSMAMFGAWIDFTEPSWKAYAVAFCFLAAAAAMFPPLWRHQTSLSLRRLRYAVAIFLTVAGLCIPVETHVVKLDMPKPAASSK